MADVLPSSAHDFRDNHVENQSCFPFFSDMRYTGDCGNQNGIDKGVKPFSNGLSVPSSGSISNSGLHSTTGSVSSDTGSLNSVFYRAKCNGNIGNDYSRDPIKISHSSDSNVGGRGNTLKHIKMHPLKSLPNNETTCGNGKRHGNSHEVTYTISDEMENVSNQVVLLPAPPPDDIDSDNDSIVGCDVVGPCSPRHLDWRDSRDFSKSPMSRTAPANSRCLCCMLLIFILSTAGLSTVLVLMYMGMLEFASNPQVQSFVGQGRVRLGDGALIREVCETTACLKTSSSILSRMNTSSDACEDFYSYACGGYAKEVDLSWFRTRIREQPDEIMQEHKRFIVDRLSESFDSSDDKLMKSAKNIFRSCLFRSQRLEADTRGMDGNGVAILSHLVSDILESLGGLKPASVDYSDLTHLLANVTRMFGASPFFKVVVHSQRKISLISRLSAYINPEMVPRDFSRKRKSSKQEESSTNTAQLKDKILHIISGSVSMAEAKTIVNSFFRLEENIRRILTSGHNRLGPHDSDNVECDEPGRQDAIGNLQAKYAGYGIDWFLFFENLLETADLGYIKLCKVQLSSPLQHLLEITPKTTLRQFILIYTLIHSDLRILYAKQDENLLLASEDSADIGETEEEQCLGLLLHFMPSLEKFAGCDESAIAKSRAKVFSTISIIRSVLYKVLTSSLNIPKENALIITNATTDPVVESVTDELVPRCQAPHGPQGTFSEYNFTSNMLRVIQHYHSEYYQGRLLYASRDIELSALWISASVPDDNRAKSGPIMYSSPIPQPILYGSLGSFLAARFADWLGIDDLLDHHSEGLLTHSTVLTLAVRLKCMVEMYNQMNILDFGSQVYKIDGELTKGLQWRDQLALNLSYKAWKSSEKTVTTDHFIPGLVFSRPQLFFLAYTQTMCEKVSARGLLKYYVSGDALPAIPNHQRKKAKLPRAQPRQRLCQPYRFVRATACGHSNFEGCLKCAPNNEQIIPFPQPNTISGILCRDNASTSDNESKEG